MPNPYFKFKQFTIHHDRCSMKVTTDSCLFGAWVANKIKGLGADKNILDIGSGSGLLTLMLAQQSSASIDGIEFQKNDYLQSLENITAAGREHQLSMFESDARTFAYQKKYDIIISNPPFYESDLKGNVESKNIAHHDTGLKLQELVAVIKMQLMPSGDFYLLLPTKRFDEIEKITEAQDLYINEIIFVHQTEKHKPFRIMLRGSFKKDDQQIGELTIKVNNDYTSAFIKPLKDYYLDF